MKALDNLKKEIQKHCQTYKRDPNVIRLIVATKYFTISQIEGLYHLGLRDFGENRVQDALFKMEQLPKDIHWHLFGHLQKNKVNKAKDRFELIHSIDSYDIAKRISDASTKVQPILLQVKMSDENTKSGFSISKYYEELPRIITLKNLEIKGLMTIAKQGSYQESLKAFQQLAELKNKTGQKNWELSMGMSEDLEAAIEAGSTMLRIGRRLL